MRPICALISPHWAAARSRRTGTACGRSRSNGRRRRFGRARRADGRRRPDTARLGQSATRRRSLAKPLAIGALLGLCGAGRRKSCEKAKDRPERGARAGCVRSCASSSSRNRMAGPMARQGGEMMASRAKPFCANFVNRLLARFARLRHRGGPLALGRGLRHNRLMSRYPDSRRQRARVLRHRIVERAQARDRGPLRLCAGARRNFGLSRPAFLGPRLFLAEGRRARASTR